MKVCHLYEQRGDYQIYPMQGGRNNAVSLYKNALDQFVLKRCPLTGVGRARFEREIAFLRLCESYGIYSVPKVRGYCELHLVLELSFETGTSHVSVSLDNAKQMLEFLTELNQRDAEDAGFSLDSIECVSSTVDFQETIDSRLKRLLGRKGENRVSPEALEKVREALFAYLKSASYQNDLKTSGALISKSRFTVFGHKFVSPSDFGSHNMLSSQGRLTFIDFEYAGFDSGLNLLGDTISQPDTKWESGVKEFFAFSLMDDLFQVEALDLTAISRLYSARWILIMLIRATSINPDSPAGVQAAAIQKYFHDSSLLEFKGRSGADG